MVTVETVYRVRIDYEVKVPDDEKVINKAFAWARKSDVYASNANGGPCWNAYLTFEGPRESDVREVAEKTVRYIKRFKDAKIYE